jgi:protocatechuate 3,4-dioxygenase beta subunit
MAAVRYPRYVVERKETAEVALVVGHAEYVSGVRVELNVDESSPTIVLERGATLRVSGYLGERQNTVTPLFAKMSGSPVADWRPAEDGILERRDLGTRQHDLLLIHQDREGFLYFSDYFQFYPTQGMTHEFNLPLQKGVQLAGKVSESVARPVKNGWVEVRVLPSEANLETIDYGSLEWIAHSAINEDGSFVIEGLPRGQGRITAACDGAVSIGEHRLHSSGTPIVTTLDRESNDVEVTMVPTATAVVRVTGPDGKPVTGAKVSFWPFVGDIDHYFAYFRKEEFSSAEAIKMPLEESATDWQGMAEEFSYASDVNGIVTIENLPPWVPRFSVVSEDFELPPDVTGARRRSIELRPGETTEVAVELVAKEADLPVADVKVEAAHLAVSEKAEDPTSEKDPPDPFARPVAPASPEHRLEGKIVDEAGKPLSGVFVDVWTQDTGTEMETDSDGHFALDVYLQFGDSVEVRFTKEGYSPVYIYQQPPGILAQPVVMTTRTFIEGTVRDSEGNPVSGVLVRADGGPRDTDSRAVVLRPVPDTVTETRTADNGGYHLKVQEGTYTITVSDEKESATMKSVEVARFERKELDIGLTRSPAFSARIVDSLTGNPVEGLRITARRTPESEVERTSDASGNIEIVGMPEGPFEFEVHGAALGIARWWSAEATEEWEKEYIEDNGRKWQRNFDDLTFAIAPDMDVVTIVTEQGARVRGTVLDPEGKPVAGATVAPALTGTSNSITGDTRFSVTTNDQGAFEILLPASKIREYNLIAHDGDYEEWRTWANGVMDPITTQPGDVIERVEIRLQRPCVIRGKAVDDAGNPLVDREVRAAAKAQNDNRYYVATTRADAEGNFELKFVAPGEHYVQVAPFWLDPAKAPEGSSQLVVAAVDTPVKGVSLVEKREE